jgi:hypothetical protein
MKIFILAFLLIGALAGGVIRSSRIQLQGGTNNTLTFACGGVNGSVAGMVYNPSAINYRYFFNNVPSFLRVSGSTLSGYVPPIKSPREFNITVSYTANNAKGSTQNFTLAQLAQSISNLNNAMNNYANALNNEANNMVNTLRNLATYF